MAPELVKSAQVVAARIALWAEAAGAAALTAAMNRDATRFELMKLSETVSPSHST